MDKKEKLRLQTQIMQILCYVDEKSEQDKMIAILEKYEAKMPDAKIKDWFDKLKKKFTKDYYSMIELLVKDIFDGKLDNSDKRLIREMLVEIQPIVEKSEKSTWQKFLDLFSWS